MSCGIFVSNYSFRFSFPGGEGGDCNSTHQAIQSAGYGQQLPAFASDVINLNPPIAASLSLFDDIYADLIDGVKSSIVDF
jgi:hypothetical protein